MTSVANVLSADLSSDVICISLIRQAITMPRVVLPRPCWSLNMQGTLAGSFFRVSEVEEMLDSADQRPLTCHHVETELWRGSVLAHGEPLPLETLEARLPHLLVKILETDNGLQLHIHVFSLPFQRIFSKCQILELKIFPPLSLSLSLFRQLIIKSNLINFKSAVIFLRLFFAKKFEICLQVVHLVHRGTDI